MKRASSPIHRSSSSSSDSSSTSTTSSRSGPVSGSVSRSTSSGFACTSGIQEDVLHPSRKQYWKRSLALLDGQLKIGCATFGNVKGFTHTVIFFHGTPGSRLDAAYLNEAAKKLNIRLLAFDRPGMGLSTYVNNREITDFAENVKDILRIHFNNTEVYLFGYSNGSAYALATSAILPEWQLKGMCIVAGLPPWHIAKQEMAASKQRVAKAVKRVPSLLAPPGDLLLGKPARSNNPAIFDRIMKQWIKTFTQSRQDLYKDETIRRTFLEAKRAAYRQPKGIIRDVVLLTSDWHVDLKKVTKRKIKMFYASEDNITHPEAGRKFAKLLPSTDLQLIEDEDHQSIIAHQGYNILSQLIGHNQTRLA